jgi:GNAT superfamily N-acetyltransferase
MMRASLRLSGVVESRGWTNALRFVATRLWRVQDDMLFVAEPAKLAMPFQQSGLRMLVLTSRNVDWALAPETHRQLFRGEAALYRDAVRQGDLGFVVLGPTDQILHQSFVHFQVRTKRLIGESDDVPLVAYCRTAPPWRGLGLFSDTLAHIMAVLSVRGHCRALVQVESLHAAAIQTLEHMGFRRLRRLQSVILLNRWCWQRSHEPGGRRRSRFFAL